ncbi:MAG: hypothetical protein V3U92_19610 [Cellulophaga sp.]
MYRIKFWFAWFLMGMIPALVMFSAFMFLGIWWALGLEIVTIVILRFIAEKIIKHPLLDMLKGEGLLTLTMDSTGTIIPFLSNVAPNKIVTRVNDQLIDTTFDRSLVHYITPPKTKGVEHLIVETKDKEGKDGIVIETNRYLKIPNKLWEHNFQFDAFPTLLFDKNSNTFITKDFLKAREDERYEHSLMRDIVRKISELSVPVRDFARYIVESTRPGFKITKGMMLAVAIIIVVIIVIWLVYSGIGSGGAQLSQTLVQPL